MSSLHETAYPRLKSEITEKDLVESYTPSNAEQAWAQAVRTPVARFGLLLHLKLFQRLGYFLPIMSVPREIIEHLGRHGQFRKLPTQKQLRDYDQSGAKHRHQKLIRAYLGVSPSAGTDKKWLYGIALRAAETKEMLADIINVMLEELVRNRFELPGFTVLKRSARRARNQVNESCFTSITSQLNAEARIKIDELLSPNGQTYSAWHILKREPKRPGNKEVRSYLQHVHWLQDLGDEMPTVKLPIVKHRQLALEARALNATEMADLKPNKRYALAVILIRSQHSKALDDVAELLIRMIRSMESHAQTALQQYLLDHQKHIDRLIETFKDVLTAYEQKSSQQQRLASIEEIIGENSGALIDRCNEHMAYAGNNYYPFMLAPYRQKRALLFNCLTILDLKSTSNDATSNALLTLFRSVQSSRSEYIKIEAAGDTMGGIFEPGWIPEKWRKLVLVKSERAGDYDLLHRKYLELWILIHIKQELSSGDLHIPHSAQFDDYREQLIDDEKLDAELEEYGQQVELPLSEPKAFCTHLKDLLTETSRQVDERFPENLHADIQNGRLILRRLKAGLPVSELKALDDLITRSLPHTSIIDVLTDTEKWLGLHGTFAPLSGNEGRLDEPQKRFITTLFCYGCNLGPTQTARSIKGISPRQVAWLNLKQATEERLDRAIFQVVNAYNKFDLPTYWGTGRHVSADGTKWDLYEQNLLSEYHIRYGGYGGIGYYHVSDTYIALFSHFIPCGVYEAVYILDGLMSNKSDIQPDTLHGDTQAQSYPVFGLSYLLGINLMPRIRNIHDLTLCRPDKRYRYRNIDSLFTGSINFKLIETHLRDMLRVAVSIKKGQITASTILRRLGTYSRKNKLYFAFRELGKVVRTLFLLRYIDEIELRKTIQSATNKSEEFNNFTKWLFFGGEGIIAENIRHEQRKIVKYNQLVANMVILHNVEQMTQALKTFSDDGQDITKDILGGLSPYRTAHINRFGDYTLDLSRKVKPLNFNTKIIS
ncbi:Tn3 family transposase [Vibrio parahaemolyticus]|nr:Tn3 family transposase [Vibrio parahaemolyticus]